jgi:hypothetical protein
MVKIEYKHSECEDLGFRTFSTLNWDPGHYSSSRSSVETWDICYPFAIKYNMVMIHSREDYKSYNVLLVEWGLFPIFEVETP